MHAYVCVGTCRPLPTFTHTTNQTKPNHTYTQTRVIEDAKRVCIARDKAKSELATIKQQAEKDKAEFEVRVPWIVVMCLTCPVDPA